MEVKEKGMNGGFSTSICLRPMLGGSEDLGFGVDESQSERRGERSEIFVGLGGPGREWIVAEARLRLVA